MEDGGVRIETRKLLSVLAGIGWIVAAFTPWLVGSYESKYGGIESGAISAMLLPAAAPVGGNLPSDVTVEGYSPGFSLGLLFLAVGVPLCVGSFLWLDKRVFRVALLVASMVGLVLAAGWFIRSNIEGFSQYVVSALGVYVLAFASIPAAAAWRLSLRDQAGV